MKLKIMIILIFILTYGVFFYSTTQTKNERIELILKEEINNLQTHYNLTMNYFIQDTQIIRENIKTNNKVINIFSEAQNANKAQRKILRDKLFKILTPMYSRIKTRGILQWQFVFPNNVSFLRMHKPSKYGDDLAAVRYSFKQVNKTKEVIIGFEQGRTTHAFRYVFPYYDNQGAYIGAMEISLASYALQEKFLNVNKIHSHFLVDKDIFNVKAWEEKDLIQKYIQSIEHKDYMYALTKNSDKNRLIQSKKNIIVPLRDKINRYILTKEPFALYSDIQETSQVITFLPIENTKENKIVAFLVSYSDNTNIHNIIHDYKKSNIIIFIGFMLLFYFIYKNLNHKKELEIEVKKQVQDIREKENLLIQQSKIAAMGEMLGNIAHQWRQPLNAVGLGIQKIKIYHEEGKLTDDNLDKTVKKSIILIKKMSTTIDDFRNFYKTDKIKKEFSVKDAVNETLSLIEASLKNSNIQIDILNINKCKNIIGYKNELEQVLLNIINNAKDALIENKTINPKITIEIVSKDDYININIYDNAGGIPHDICEKIFDPYFTTKDQGKGTGIGLYMSKIIINNSMNGELNVHNYKDGACFTIKLF